MPRKKPAIAARARIQERLTVAAYAFAEEVLRILGESTMADLAALAGHSLEGIPPRRGPGRPSKAEAELAKLAALAKAIPAKRVPPRTSVLRRMAGTKPVPCPVQDCKNPGVRSKMNFCNEHAAELSKNEMIKLRQQQKSSHVAESLELPQEKQAKGKKKKK